MLCDQFIKRHSQQAIERRSWRERSMKRKTSGSEETQVISHGDWRIIIRTVRVSFQSEGPTTAKPDAGIEKYATREQEDQIDQQSEVVERSEQRVACT